MKNERTYGRFFLPGPTEVRPEVLEAMTRPMIAHRSGEFEGLFGRLQAGLGAVFRTARPVYISSSSATGLMEAAIRNAPEGSILCIVNGAFASRFAHIAKACGRDVEVLDVDYGRAADVGMARAALAKRRFAAMTVVHNETSTGALSDIAALAAACREHDTMLLVDSVSGIGGVPFHPDDWGVDFVLTGSQKALALPPGLAFAVASPRFLEQAAQQRTRGTYFDLVEFDKFAAKRQTPNTPALSLLYALDIQLEHIVKEGIEARWARHAAMADRTAEWASEVAAERPGVGILPPPGERSPTVSAITMPEGASGSVVAGAMAEAGFVIASGYGPLKERTVRVGHMGDHTLEALDECLAMLATMLGRPSLA